MRWNLSDRRLDELLDDIDGDALDDLVDDLQGLEATLQDIIPDRDVEVVITVTDRRAKRAS